MMTECHLCLFGLGSVSESRRRDCWFLKKKIFFIPDDSRSLALIDLVHIHSTNRNETTRMRTDTSLLHSHIGVKIYIYIHTWLDQSGTQS